QLHLRRMRLEPVEIDLVKGIALAVREGIEGNNFAVGAFIVGDVGPSTQARQFALGRRVNRLGGLTVIEPQAEQISFLAKNASSVDPFFGSRRVAEFFVSCVLKSRHSCLTNAERTAKLDIAFPSVDSDSQGLDRLAIGIGTGISRAN